MRPQVSRRRTLPTIMAVLAATGVLTTTPALTGTASPAQAADEFTCKSTAALWQPQPDAPFLLHTHNEPETGVDSWENAKDAGSGWPAATWAGPDNRMYYLRASDGTLQRHRWTSTGWEGNGISKTIATGMDYWADKPGKVTVDSAGAFYLVDENGDLRRRTYNETTEVWDDVVIDGGWGGYRKIFAAGDGVLYAVSNSGGILTRFRYHAGSGRWLQYKVIVNPTSGPVRPGYFWADSATSPGADILYGIQFDKLVWHRYNESTGTMSSGTVTGTWNSPNKTIVASPDSCRRLSEPNPDRPNVGPANHLAKASLLKTSNGHLQYAYLDTFGKPVHADIRDVTSPGSAGFSTLPDAAAFTDVPALAESAGGSLGLLAQADDADLRVFNRAAGSVAWSSSLNRAGRMATPSQAVRTADNKVAYYALDANGYVWTKFQTRPDGPVNAWRQLTSGTAMSFTKNFTTTTVDNSVHLTALRTTGDYCKTTITSGVATAWTCGGTSATSAPAVVVLSDNTLQLFARRSDGKVYTSRTATTGEINGAWTQAAPGDLPNGVQAVGDPAALIAPNGTIQVVVRGSDGFTYRTGQQASSSTAWWPWTEITNYGTDNAVDPAVSQAGGTWVIAYRTPSGIPKLVRWDPNATVPATTQSVVDSGAGQFVEVPLHR
jgi:hypothetical protein